jgi:hypothetical protein
MFRIRRVVIVIIRSHSDHNVKEFFSPDVSIPDPPNHRIEVDHTLFRCDDNKFGFDIVESWNASNELVRVQVVEPSNVIFSEFQETSPFALLQGIVCGKSYAGLGINLTADGTSIKVAQVFDGSPAERVGVKINDIITHIDNESVTGLTLEQIVKKLRGLPKTKVVLTIVRDGQDKPLELSAVRETIQTQSTQVGPRQ